MKKSRKAAGKEKNLQGRVRSSLVLKLTLRMTWTLLCAFLAFNLVGLLLYTGVVMRRAEEGAGVLMAAKGTGWAVERSSEDALSEWGPYHVETREKPAGGLRVPAVFRPSHPLASSVTERRLVMPGLFSLASLKERLYGMEYHLHMKEGRDDYLVVIDLEQDVRELFRLTVVLWFLQGFFLLNAVHGNARAVRKTLRPLSELAETARKLEQEATSFRSGSEDVEIRHLAGTISTIDVDGLDKQISVEGTQNELKELAAALNDMLQRINGAYQSQIRFVSDASHELRTPIAVIQGYAGLLDRWGKEDEKIRQESIDAIRDETEHMKALVEQLLFLARGDNDSLQLHPEVFDACDLVRDILRETRLIDENRIMTSELEPPALLKADEQLLKQAIRILVDNGIKYSAKEDLLKLSVFCQDGTVHIQVQDQGIGIPAEEVSSVFQRFYRSDESRARKTGGAGLGLAIARWIVERHSGHFEIVSRLHIGTRVTLLFPEFRKEGESGQDLPLLQAERG